MARSQAEDVEGEEGVDGEAGGASAGEVRVGNGGGGVIALLAAVEEEKEEEEGEGVQVDPAGPVGAVEKEEGGGGEAEEGGGGDGEEISAEGWEAPKGGGGEEDGKEREEGEAGHEGAVVLRAGDDLEDLGAGVGGVSAEVGDGAGAEGAGGGAERCSRARLQTVWLVASGAGKRAARAAADERSKGRRERR